MILSRCSKDISRLDIAQEETTGVSLEYVDEEGGLLNGIEAELQGTDVVILDLSAMDS